MWLFDLLKFKEQTRSYVNDRPAFVKQIDNSCGYNRPLSGIIIINKEDFSMVVNEYLDGFMARKEELEQEKVVLENANIDALVEEEFAKVREEIKEKVLKEHQAKIDDKNFEILAIQRLIDKELARIEAENVNNEEITE